MRCPARQWSSFETMLSKGVNIGTIFLITFQSKSFLGFGVPFLQGILHSALHGEFWRLIDPQGKPPGVMGWWPSRAVTFLENHDTGSTQVPFVDGTSYATSFLQWKRYVGN